jgi:hypothetical protein
MISQFRVNNHGQAHIIILEEQASLELGNYGWIIVDHELLMAFKVCVEELQSENYSFWTVEKILLRNHVVELRSNKDLQSINYCPKITA